MNKRKRILVLVESPNKVATISEILRSEGSAFYVVKASVGHISQLKDSGDYNLGIDIKNNFKPDYQILSDKKKIVDELKDQVAYADEVYLCSDPDREGEQISWSLKKFLNIPNDKYKRITFHEITKQAVLKAIDDPRKIDMDLVIAAQTRAKLDKIIGYLLSNIARNQIHAKSVGRCQSAGLKLIVDREKEIRDFKSTKYYDLFLNFVKNNKEFKAKYCSSTGESISFDKLEDCDKIANECKGNDYFISDVSPKKSLENPPLPFITSTFQQEVSKKLGISIESATSHAQKLFEGINVGGKHIALTTYLRTDDANIAPEFIPVLKEFIERNFGSNYYSPIKKAKKKENSQEGHECFRVVDLEMTPEKLSRYIQDDTLLKIYTIIYKRTLAAAMRPAEYNTVKYIINNRGTNRFFVMNSKELAFEGYKKVYNYTADDSDEEYIKDSFSKNEILKDTKLEAIEKETNPPKRYVEASLVKELDKRGIGRPSTFSSILKTLLSQDRGYCEVIKKEIVPTEKGIQLSEFLDESFQDVINLNYTKEMEDNLDLIAQGKLNDVKFLKEFYEKLDKDIKKADGSSDVKCPLCGSSMVVRKGPYGKFLGCSNFPTCKGMKKLYSK